MSTRQRKPADQFRKPQREKLTVERLDSLLSNPPAERIDLWDLYCPGLAARVSPRGRVTFNVLSRVKTPGGAAKAIRFRVGLYPRISLKEARARASAALLQVEEGLDPRYERQVERDTKLRAAEKARTNTFKKALADYADLKMIGPDPANPLRGRYGKELIADLESEFRDDFIPQREVVDPKTGATAIETKPLRAGLANVPLAMVEWRHIQARLDDATWRGADSRAHHLYAHARGLFNWAHKGARKATYGLSENIFAGQSAEDATNRKKGERQRHLADHELRLIWNASAELPDPYKSALRLLMYTSTRLSDVLQSKGTEFDLQKREFIIPGPRHKSRKDFLVTLSSQAVELISQLPNLKEGKYVFTTTYGLKPFGADSKMKKRLDEIVTRLNGGKPIPEWVHHDFRRACRTWLAKHGVSHEVGEAVLGHKTKGIARVYNLHTYAGEKAICLQQWADALDAIVADQPAPRGQNVVNFANASR